MTIKIFQKPDQTFLLLDVKLMFDVFIERDIYVFAVQIMCRAAGLTFWYETDEWWFSPMDSDSWKKIAPSMGLIDMRVFTTGNKIKVRGPKQTIFAEFT